MTDGNMNTGNKAVGFVLMAGALTMIIACVVFTMNA